MTGGMARGPEAGRKAKALSLETARQAWGEALPAWIEALASACDKTSQNVIARQLGVSAAQISCVLNRKYKGSYAGLECLAHDFFLRGKVACPVLGEITSRECLAQQKRPFVASSPQAVRLYRACKSCPHGKERNDV